MSANSGKRMISCQVTEELYNYCRTIGNGIISRGVELALRDHKLRNTKGLTKQSDEDTQPAQFSTKDA